jgi:hypothetical protein
MVTQHKSANSIVLRDVLRNLRVPTAAGEITLPDWSQFFVSIGRAVARETSPRARISVGVAVPTRNYATAFTLLGVALMKAVATREFDAERHFEILRSLPVNTPVAIRDGTKRQYGLLLGCEDIAGLPHIRVQTSDKQRRNNHELFRQSRVHLIELIDADNSSSKDPFRKNRLKTEAGILRAMLPSIDIDLYVNYSRADTVIIGPSRMLNAELTMTEIRYPTPLLGLQSGRIQDIVRLRLDERHPYHSLVVPPTTRHSARLSKRIAPDVVIFDGASGFLRNRHFWTNSHQIMLLDRTDSAFAEATDAWNDEYLQRANDVRLREIPNPPAGIEWCAFER